MAMSEKYVTENNSDELEFPLFQALPHLKARCGACLDTAIFRRPCGEIVACPRHCLTLVNEAARQLHHAVFERAARKLWIDPQAFDLARILTHYTAENPCKRERLETLFFAEHPEAKAGDGERKIKGLIEILRHDWLLPVGSSKRLPYGHWIITNATELHDWRKAAQAAPITQLATIYRVVRANRERFAGQVDFDFKDELASEIESKIAEMERAA